VSLDDLEAKLKRLMIAALAGDGAAYRRFLDEISARLRAYLRRQLARHGRPDAGEAEDVLQETLLAIHASQTSYDPASPVTAWAHAIARYKLVDHLRRTGRHAGHAPLEESEHLMAHADPVASEARMDLAAAMTGLPERTRRLIERVKVEGYSVAEAARAAGMSETAVKVAIHRGLKALARTLRAGRRTAAGGDGL
jgi:RNA polymerase sigma-70 factor (ECF subfamily)